MSFDESYDEMLHDEFSSRGKHRAKGVGAEPELVESNSRGRHAAAEEAETETEDAEPPRGLQRYRTAGLVGAGGLACAAAGAFLGGLGGYFTISPAAAHPVAAPTITQDTPPAQAIGHGTPSPSGARGTSAVTAAEISKVLGSLTEGIAPFASLTSDPFGNLPVNGLPGVGGSGAGKGRGGAGNGTAGGGSGGGGLTGCVSGSSGLDLNCILSRLTGALTNLGSLTGGNPGTMVNGLVPTLSDVVTDVTGTLQNLTTLLPIASLPLPSGGIPTTLLAGSGGGPTTGIPGTSGGAGSNPVVSALSPVLNTVGPATGALGTGTSIPALPSPATTGTTVPSLTTPGPTTAPSSGSSTANVPVPVNTPTITIGGLSVGVSGSGATSGLTLTLP